MKVCIFTLTECIDQADSRVLKEAKALVNAGYDVNIVAIMGEEKNAYEEVGALRIFRVSLLIKQLSLVIQKPSPRPINKEINACTDVEPLQQDDIDIVRSKAIVPRKFFITIVIRLLPLLRKFYSRYITYFEYYWRSFFLVRKGRADIYHAHDLMTLPLAWILARITKGKVLYDSHELWLDRNRKPKRSRLNRFLVKRVESFLIKRSDATITVSESIAETLSARYGITKPEVIINAPEYHEVQRSNVLRDEIGISNEERIILYIGAITFNRGLEELIQSLKYLNGCCIVLMGYGTPDYISSLTTIIEYESLTERVYFFGPVPHEDVPYYAASADLGASPIKNACLSYYYCSPNKVFECIAAGLPVVGSDFPDLKSVIEGHRLGVTFNPDSPEDIARSINYVLSDRDRYEGMSRNAREAAKIYNWQNESTKLLAIYERFNSD